MVTTARQRPVTLTQGWQHHEATNAVLWQSRLDLPAPCSIRDPQWAG